MTETLSSCSCTRIDPIRLNKTSLLFFKLSSIVFKNVCVMPFACAVLKPYFLRSSSAKVEAVVGDGFSFMFLKTPLRYYLSLHLDIVYCIKNNNKYFIYYNTLISIIYKV